MRQLVCMSADVYCQITNNHFYATPTFLYSNRKKGKRASCQRDRERECARDRAWLKTELASVRKMAVGRRINYFKIYGNSNIRWETILMGKKDYERYIKIKINVWERSTIFGATTSRTFPIEIAFSNCQKWQVIVACLA
jgi:hypothetical protein